VIETREIPVIAGTAAAAAGVAADRHGYGADSPEERP